MTTPPDPFDQSDDRPVWDRPADQDQPPQPAWSQPPHGQHPSGQQPGWPPYGQPGWGQPPYGQQPGWGAPPPVRGTNGMAIAALVMALACCSPLGVVFGVIARSQIKRTGEAGDGLALAAIITGGVLSALLVLAVTLGVFSGSSTYTYP